MVEPHRAVSEPDYFMKLIEMCEYLFDQDVEARESGKLTQSILEPKPDHEVIHEVNEEDADETVEKQQPLTEWEKLQSLPHDQYLIQTIMPVLHQGLKLIATERPE